ncbi:hypothetical protein BDV12DRAFT_202625 [Aspergillus spectabilis]
MPAESRIEGSSLHGQRSCHEHVEQVKSTKVNTIHGDEAMKLIAALTFKPSQILDALLDICFWPVIAIATLTMIANGPQSTFQAIIVNSFGFSSLNSLLRIQLVGPYLAYNIMSSLLLWLLPRSALGGLLVGSPIQRVYEARVYLREGGGGFFIAYSFGNVVGPLLFAEEDAPRYISGWTIVVATHPVAVVLTVVYRLVCVCENRRRDGTGVMESFDYAFEDDLTDRKNPQFRYVY